MTYEDDITNQHHQLFVSDAGRTGTSYDQWRVLDSARSSSFTFAAHWPSGCYLQLSYSQRYTPAHASYTY